MPRDAFIAFRRSLGRTPPLQRMTVRVRGLDFAVWTSDPVGNATPLLLVNGGLLYDHSLLWPSLSPLAADRQVILYDQRGRG
jgi:proline iminopeptidase